MDIREWMHTTWTDEVNDAAKKRNKQGDAVRKYKQISKRGISSETSYRDLLQRTAKKQKEKEEG